MVSGISVLVVAYRFGNKFVLVVAYHFGNKFDLSKSQILPSCIWRRQQRKAADGYIRTHYKQEEVGK